MDVVFDVADADFRAAFRRNSGNRHAGADPSTASRCRKSTWGPAEPWRHPRSPGHPHLLRRRLRPAGTVARSSSRARFSACSGRNGVGKTTLVNSIVGFNPPRRGKIVFKGDDITHKLVVRDRAQRHGAGAAGTARVPDAERRGKPAGGRAQPRAARLESASASTSCFRACSERRDQRAKTLSGGEQQMLAIGRGADDQPGLPDHGRAVRRARAHHHPGRCGRRSAS